MDPASLSAPGLSAVCKGLPETDKTKWQEDTFRGQNTSLGSSVSPQGEDIPARQYNWQTICFLPGKCSNRTQGGEDVTSFICPPVNHQTTLLPPPLIGAGGWWGQGISRAVADGSSLFDVGGLRRSLGSVDVGGEVCSVCAGANSHLNCTGTCGARFFICVGVVGGTVAVYQRLTSCFLLVPPLNIP